MVANRCACFYPMAAPYYDAHKYAMIGEIELGMVASVLVLSNDVRQEGARQQSRSEVDTIQFRFR